MATITEQVQTKVKNKQKDLEKATAPENLDAVLNNVKKLDNTCSFTKCKKNIGDFAIHCKFCNRRFCTTHGLPEIHGCGEAVRKDEIRKFLHPPSATKLPDDKHNQAQTKLNQKLRQMQLERKAKQSKNKKK